MNQEERQRAKQAELGTLPAAIWGANCCNCRFFKRSDKFVNSFVIGMCDHALLRVPVNERMHCKFWDAVGMIPASGGSFRGIKA